MGLKELTPDKEQGRNKISLATLLKIEQNFGCSRSALLMRLKGLGWISDEAFVRYQKMSENQPLNMVTAPDSTNRPAKQSWLETTT